VVSSSELIYRRSKIAQIFAHLEQDPQFASDLTGGNYNEARIRLDYDLRRTRALLSIAAGRNVKFYSGCRDTRQRG
jgi:hypothetical protein